MRFFRLGLGNAGWVIFRNPWSANPEGALGGIRGGKPEAIRFDDVVEEGYLTELGRLAEAETDAVTQRRVDELEIRIRKAEERFVSRLLRTR